MVRRPLTRKIKVEAPLKGRSILVVEDDAILATDLTVSLREMGAEVVLTAPSNPAALSAMAHYVFEAAVLDVNVQNEWVFPVANALQGAGIPFLFLTAYAPESIPAEHRDKPFLRKPHTPENLAERLHGLLVAGEGKAAAVNAVLEFGRRA
jgi:CheY-like chemotaxis protein